MAAEGGYAVSGQFNAIADSAASAVLNIQKLATEFAAFSASVGSVTSSIKAFADLQQTLVLTNSIAGGTAKELQNMNDAVRNMALGFKFSATEGAQALYFLSSAGFSVQQSLSALNGVALLAQATLTDLAQTSDTIANTLSAFNLEADQSTRVANLFAAAISVTQATMDKLSYSMRYVGPVAAEMGASVEQTVVALSGLYQVGNRGQQAGTLLRDVLIRLVNPSAEAATVLSKVGISVADTDGKVRNFVDILKDLQKVNLSPISLAKIFEQRGVSGASTLISLFDAKDFERRLKDTNGSLTEFGQQVKNVADKAGRDISSLSNMWEYLTLAETNTNFATKLALEQNQTLSSSFSRAANAVKELGISFGEQLAPGMQSIANFVTSIAIGFRGLDDSTKALISDLPFLTVGILGVYKAAGLLSGQFDKAITAFRYLRGTAPTSAAAGAAGAAGISGTAQSAALTLNTAHLEAELLALRGVIASNNAEITILVAAINRLATVMAAVSQGLTFRGVAQNGNLQFRNGGQFAATPNLGNIRPVQAPAPIVNPATGTATNAAVQAASGAGAALGAATAVRSIGGIITAVVAGLTGIVGIVLAAISIGGLIALAWPLVRDLINKQPGKASFQSKDFAGEAEQAVQSINQQPVSPFKKSQSLSTYAEGQEDSFKFFTQALKDNSDAAAKASAEIREYIAAQLELKGKTALAKKVRDDTSITTESLFRIPTVANKLSRDTSLQNLKETYDNANRDVDNAKQSLDNYAKGREIIKKAQERFAALPSFAPEKAAFDIAEKIKKEREGIKVPTSDAGGNQVTVILDGYIKELEKEARDAQSAARKAQLLLKSDPIQQFLGEVSDTIESQAGKIKSFGDKIEKDVQGGTSNLKSFLANVKGYLPGEFAKVLSGQSFSYFEGDQRIDVKSVADKLIAGVPIDQVIVEYKEAVRRFKEKADIKDPAFAAETNAVVDAFLKYLDGIAKDQKAQIQTKLFALISAQEANEEFANKLKDTYSKIQEGYFAAVSDAIGGQVPQLKLRVDLGSLERQLRDQLVDIRKQRIELLKKIGAESQGDTPAENAAKIQSANDWANSTANAAQQQYYQQVRNRVNEAVQAQKRLADEIRLTAASTRTTQAQLASDLVDLYAKFGLKIPQDVFNAAAQLEFAQTDQKIQQTINDTKAKIDKLTNEIKELDRFIANPNAVAGGNAPKLSIEVTGGPTDKMLDAMSKGTADFSAKFGTDLTAFNKTFDDTLRKFLFDFSAAIGKPITVTPQENINNRFPSGTGLPNAIQYGQSTAPAWLGTATTALPFSGTQPVQAPAQNLGTVSLTTSNVTLPSGSSQVLTSAFVDQVKKFEGFSSKAYWDYKQYSIGYGTRASGPNDTTDTTAATQRLVEELTKAANVVENVNKDLPVGVKQALTDLTFNAGSKWTQQGLGDAARAGDIDRILAILPQYNRAGGDVNSELVTRRADEVSWANSPLGGTSSAPQTPDPQKIQEATAAYQAYLAITGQATAEDQKQSQTLMEMAQTQQQVTQVTQQQVQAAQQSSDAKRQELASAKEALQTVQTMQATNSAGQNAPDAQAVAKWNEYTRAVQEASRTLAGSNNMMRGFQVANSQLVAQLGRDAKLASDVYQTAANSIATNLTALITGTQKDWRVALKNIANDIATTIIKALILRALTSVGGSIFGSVAPVPSAKGSYFDGGTSYFASGGVFDKPTQFAFLSGGQKRKGVMGEAGPEAIMPLVRGPDGKLAVRALSTPITPISPAGNGSGGGGYSYNPSFTFVGSDGSTSNQPNSGNRQDRNRLAAMQKELDREIESTVVRVIGKHSRNGGFLNPSAQRLGLAGGS